MNGQRVTGPARQAIFRCDGGAAIGYGHIARCQTLARLLSSHGWECSFAVSKETAGLPLWKRHSFPLIVLENPLDPACFVANAGADKDLVVIDHYQLDVRYEEAARDLAATRLVFEDVPGRRHSSEILLDASFGRTAEAYQTLVPETCRLLLGSKFVPLASEFGVRRRDFLENGSVSAGVSNIFVCFGGIDGKKLVIEALQALDMIEEHLCVNVAIGAGADHLSDIRDIAENSHQDVTVHEDCDHIAAQLANADLALGAGGLNAWERCVLGVPSIVACTADNQRDLCRALVAEGAALGVVEPGRGGAVTMHRFLEILLADTLLRRKMRHAAMAFCDGMGTRNVAAAIQETVSQNAV